MDILVSSNLERLLYLLSQDTALVADLMGKLNKEGSYTVPGQLLEKIQASSGRPTATTPGLRKSSGRFTIISAICATPTPPPAGPPQRIM